MSETNRYDFNEYMEILFVIMLITTKDIYLLHSLQGPLY